jgi:hypothetical protein
MSKSIESKININNLGGWHPDKSERKKYAIEWPIGSIFANEGRRLYDLVIKLKPNLIVEVGGYHGCSGLWMALALKENGKGKLISIDNGQLNGKWAEIPEEFMGVVELRSDDALTCEVPKNIDILFEDGAHTYGFTHKIIDRFKAKVVVCHDYMHWDCVKTVKHDFNKILGIPDEVFFEKPSDCGLAIKYIS